MVGGLVGVEPVSIERNSTDKKKRRSNRRSKLNSSLLESSSSSDVRNDASEAMVNSINNDFELSKVNISSKQFMPEKILTREHGLVKASNVAFNSMPQMHISEKQPDPTRVNPLQIQHIYHPDFAGQNSSSCPVQNSPRQPVESFLNNKEVNLSQHQTNGIVRPFFAPHWSEEAVDAGLEKGDLFKAVFRVNAHNRLEAYCKIDGVPVDILISGITAQNRAVEGDIVAIKVDPVPLWTKMKGAAGQLNSSVAVEDHNLLDEVEEIADVNVKGKVKVGIDHRNSTSTHKEAYYSLVDDGPTGNEHFCGHKASTSKYFRVGCSSDKNVVQDAVAKICATISSSPLKRPTGRVVAILERSARRDSIVGFLDVKQWLTYKELNRKDSKKKSYPLFAHEYIQLAPIDPKYPKMMVSMVDLPEFIKKRLIDGDSTVQMELVAARIREWVEESSVPQAQIMYAFGQGGDIEAHLHAILFENGISYTKFSPDSLSCLPRVPWEIPLQELRERRDLRDLCIFTVDPSTATDLDDALSVENISNGILRVGVHIADVSYFVTPDSALDKEAQLRSTSVYMLRQKLPMLPPLLSEDIGSLNPGVDRLAFSILWDMNLEDGMIIDRWIGRTIINSCCKLSYENAQEIIDSSVNLESLNSSGYPKIHSQFGWADVIKSIESLNEISIKLKKKRFADGALWLESSKVAYLFDENGSPYDGKLSERKECDSHCLVEEFMLLANRTAAEIISQAFPDSALLRRHPEPNLRKLKELEAFCSKHGLDVDTSSSGQLNLSLARIKEKLKHDSVLFDILINYASKPMQLASYFCTGDLKDAEDDWSHYALAVPLYTHFTSPLRRYPDIVVHRTLAAVIEAESTYAQRHLSLQRQSEQMQRCFTGMPFNKDAAESSEGQAASSAAGSKHRVPCTELLSDVSAHCNKRKLASRYVKDSCDKLYMWSLLKKKQVLLSEARVLGLGPKFMSIYIQKLAIERRVYYDEVEGLRVEWLEATSTLVLSLSANRRPSRRGSPSKWKMLEDVALVICPSDVHSESDLDMNGGSLEPCSTTQVGAAVNIQNLGLPDREIIPEVFPLTVRLLSTIPVALHAIGGEDGPLDVGAKLYLSSYFK